MGAGLVAARRFAVVVFRRAGRLLATALPADDLRVRVAEGVRGGDRFMDRLRVGQNTDRGAAATSFNPEHASHRRPMPGERAHERVLAGLGGRVKGHDGRLPRIEQPGGDQDVR